MSRPSLLVTCKSSHELGSLARLTSTFLRIQANKPFLRCAQCRHSEFVKDKRFKSKVLVCKAHKRRKTLPCDALCKGCICAERYSTYDIFRMLNPLELTSAEYRSVKDYLPSNEE